jgi:hypothetical protein
LTTAGLSLLVLCRRAEPAIDRVCSASTRSSAAATDSSENSGVALAFEPPLDLLAIEAKSDEAIASLG